MKNQMDPMDPMDPKEARDKILEALKIMEQYGRNDSFLCIKWDTLAALLREENAFSPEEWIAISDRIDQILDYRYPFSKFENIDRRIEFFQRYLELVKDDESKCAQLREKLKRVETDKKQKVDQMELHWRLDREYRLPSRKAHKKGLYLESRQLLEAAIADGEDLQWFDSREVAFWIYCNLAFTLTQLHEYDAAETILRQQRGWGGLPDFDHFIDVEIASINLRSGNFDKCLQQIKITTKEGLRFYYDGWHPNCEMMNRVLSHMTQQGLYRKAAKEFHDLLRMQKNLYIRPHQVEFQPDDRIVPLLELGLIVFKALKNTSSIALAERLLDENRGKVHHDNRLLTFDQALQLQRRVPDFLSRRMRGFFPDDEDDN